ncbi:hypothetical protein ACFV2H_36690 [Streptomyces sp. NPDC059629]|uniref:hypothetical protein n=1 Tax=Streptomyces sp. NPDC059629 TaxID=3346889 RepID=UPI0036802CD0
MAAHGFEVRIATTPLPQGTVIIDRRTMILTDPVLPATAVHGRRTYTMSAAPALVGGAYALFEAAWESATDLVALLDAERPWIDARPARVLRALGSGATDEAAARELGMSLRTYRRRVAELLVTLNAGSRFQAGVRECGSAGVRECGSAGVRECGSAGVRECGSAGGRVGLDPRVTTCALRVPWPPDGPSRHQKGRGPKTPPDPQETPGQGHTRQYG